MAAVGPRRVGEVALLRGLVQHQGRAGVEAAAAGQGPRLLLHGGVPPLAEGELVGDLHALEEPAVEQPARERGEPAVPGEGPGPQGREEVPVVDGEVVSQRRPPPRQRRPESRGEAVQGPRGPRPRHGRQEHRLRRPHRLVVVDVLVHVGPGDDVPLHRGQGPAVHEDAPLPGEEEEQDAPQVEAAVAHPRGQHVPLQVVEPIRVELARDQVREESRRTILSPEERVHPLRQVPGEAPQRPVHLRPPVQDDCRGPALVPGPGDGLEGVGEGAVAHVVEERRRQDHGLVAAQPRGRPAERVEHLPRHGHDPERVGEAGVLGAGEDQVRQAELADAAEPLDLAGLHEGEKEPVRPRGSPEGDVVVHRVAEVPVARPGHPAPSRNRTEPSAPGAMPSTRSASHRR